MIPKSGDRFSGKIMLKQDECMPPKSAQWFWDNDMHQTKT